MHIQSLQISNFRAIRSIELPDLQKMVVIAGTNGSGKSSVFNAIRLLKSAYGEYSQNEWRSWFQEFQIDLQDFSQNTKSILADASLPLSIQAEFVFSQDEIDYLEQSGRTIIEQGNWKRATGHRRNSIDIVSVPRPTSSPAGPRPRRLRHEPNPFSDPASSAHRIHAPSSAA